MLYFCTLFNKNYLSRGLAMLKSLKKHCSDAHIFVFAFDNETVEYLEGNGWDFITVIDLKSFEDPELLQVKPTRTLAEYCWTATSSTLLYVFKHFPEVDKCTYVDADLYFYHSPAVLIHELPSNKSVLLTEHRYTSRYDTSKKTGKYCVQFMTFRNNADGLQALEWWRAQCLNWCYARFENGKFGDQKYLDDWTTRFPFTYILKNLGGGIAPWNIQQYDLAPNNYVIHDSNEKSPLYFYHFHYVRFYYEYLELGRFKLSDEVINQLYKPYIQELLAIEEQIAYLNPNGRTKYPYSWKFPLVQLWRKINGVNYLFSWNQWNLH